MSNKALKFFACSASIGAIALAAPAAAQDLETEAAEAEGNNVIIVTATKRAQGLQDVPLSIQALSGDELTEQNVYDLADVGELVPNLTFSSTPGVSSIFIRGAGTGSVNNSAEQSVGMFVDGVYASRGFQFNAPFFDMESVEVLKGPQGVLQGKNSIAGAILVNSRRPGSESGGYARASYEIENQGYSVEGAVTAAISDRFSLRMGGQHVFEGGWLDTISRPAFDGTLIEGREDQNTFESSTLRLSAEFEASSNLDLYAKVELGERTRTGENFGAAGFQPGAALPTGLPIETFYGLLAPGFGLIGDGIVTQGNALALDPARNQFVTVDREIEQYVTNAGVVFQFDLDVGSIGTITGITGYSEYDVENSTTNTMAPYDGFFSFTREGEKAEDFDQFTQEIRLLSPGGATIDYIFGAFYQDRNIRTGGETTIFNASNSVLANIFGPAIAPVPTAVLDAQSVDSFSENTEAFALFGQLTWNVSDALRVNVGGRYSDETKTPVFNSGGQEFLNPSPANAILFGIFGIVPFTTADLAEQELVERNFDPSASVQFDVSDDLMFYGSWTQATKAGGFNEGANTAATAIFGPEEAEAFELGLKGSAFDGALIFNLALFHTEFSDLQVSALDTASAVPTFIFQNAAEATSKGVEFDFRWSLTDNLVFGGAVGYLDATFDDFPGAGCANGISQEANCVADPVTGALSRNAAGDTLRFAPEWTSSAYLDYTAQFQNGMTLGLRGDVKYRDDAFIAATNDPFLAQEAFAKVDLQASLTDPSGRYTFSVIGKNVTDKSTASFGGPTPFFTGAYWSNNEAPRQIYFNLSANF